MADSTAARSSASRGAPGRVAAVHDQTRRGLACAAAFTLAAVAFVFIPHETGGWLPLHLFLLGGLLMAISATTQMLAVTWSTSRAPRPGVATAQRWCLAVGVIALGVGRETEVTLLVDVGGVAVVVAIAAMIPILLGIRRGAVVDRFTPVTDAYVMAMVAGVVGTAVAAVLATDRAGSRWAELRNVHLTVNTFGLVGIVIAATLPFFAATQARRKVSRRATPGRIRIATSALTAATIAAGVGQWLDRSTLTAVGLLVYAGGIALIATMLPIYGRRQVAWAGPRLIQLASGIVWWIATTIVLAFTVSSGGDDRAVLRALVIGGFGQILISSLAYLGPVLRGGGGAQLTAGFAITRSWPSLIAGNLAALGALIDLDWLFEISLVIWLVDTAVRTARLVATRESPTGRGERPAPALTARGVRRVVRSRRDRAPGTPSSERTASCGMATWEDHGAGRRRDHHV